MATWKKWKEAVEALGVTDDDEIVFIDSYLETGELRNLLNDVERYGLVTDWEAIEE